MGIWAPTCWWAKVKNPHALVTHGQTLFDMGRKPEARELWANNTVEKKFLPEYLWHQAILEINGNYANVDEEEEAINNYEKSLDKFEIATKNFKGEELVGLEQVVGTAQPFYLCYLAKDDRDVQNKYGQMMSRIMAAWQKKRDLYPRKKHGVDVLFISGHIRDHSVWNAFLKGYAVALKEAGIKTAAFYTERKIDEKTIDAKELFDKFIQGPKPFETWVKLACELSPKIIIYPEVGMDPVTARLASLKLAPTQVASWGHPSTTGFPTIDYFLSGALLEPQNGQQHYTEKLVPLALHGATYQPLLPEDKVHDFTQLGLRKDALKLLLPHTPFKLLPSHDDIWVEIAKSKGDFQIILFESPMKKSYSSTVSERLKIKCELAGVDFENKFKFIPWLGRASFYALFRSSNLYLDSVGFSGFNTAMQATECILPVLAYEGNKMRGRLASSINRAMGLESLIVNNHEDFINKAKEIIENPAMLTPIKKIIEEKRGDLYNRTEPAEDFLKFIKSIIGN